MVDIKNTTVFSTDRLTRKQKEKNDFAWYKEKADFYETEANISFNRNGGEIDEYKRMKVNYDLFNNILDLSDFSYVCTPFGAEVGELPARMTNKDISSYRIKALIGMEMRSPFGFRVVATNKEATTRKEQEEASRIRQYVIDSIMAPVKAEAEAKYREQLTNTQLTPKQKQEIQAQIEAEIEANTPDRIRKYMKRDHQDPAEVQGNQILNFLIQNLQLKNKFSKGWKHALLSAYEVYYIGIVNGKPVAKVVNPLRFACDLSPDLDFIENGQWAVAEFRMHPYEVISQFDLTDKEIDEVNSNYQHRVAEYNAGGGFFENRPAYDEDTYNTISVKHIVFRGQRRVGWLDYQDLETGEIHSKFMVDEEYKLNPEAGDIYIEWEWIDEVYEVWKIGTNIYKNMRPVEGQLKDEKNIYNAPLPYYGGIYDNMNSLPTSVMDRMKVYQYYYNIIMYRIELLTASDEGKKILMNINAIPSDSGIDIAKWQHFFKSTPFMFFNPDEEGMTHQDVNTIAKTLDLSLASDIGKYIEFAEYLEQKCGKSVGVTDPVLGQTAVSERVSNNQQNLIQTGHMLEPYFNYHNHIKRNVLQGLLNCAKIAYSDYEDQTLTYFLDDMSIELLNIDTNLLSESTLALFIEDATASNEIKETIKTLAHAAMQNQKIELSDVLKVIKEDSIQEAEESLLIAEEIRIEREQKEAEKEREHQINLEERKEEFAEKQHTREIEKIVKKEEERRKTVIQQQSMLSVGFNEEKDMDGDGKLDVLEIARDGIAASISMSQERRADLELAHKMKIDQEEINVKREALKQKTKAPNK